MGKGWFKKGNGGDAGIRTQDTRFAHIHDFQSCSFSQLGHISASWKVHFFRTSYSVKQKSMPEVAKAGEDKANIIFIAGMDNFLITFGTARFDDGFDPILMQFFNGIHKREKAV